MLPSETRWKKSFEGPTCRLAIETTSRRLALMIWFLTARASSWSRSTSSRSEVRALVGLDRVAELAGQEPEVVHLPEQVAFLLAGQERDLVEAGQVGGQPLGGLGPPRGLAVERLGHRAEDLVAGGGVVEARDAACTPASIP